MGHRGMCGGSNYEKYISTAAYLDASQDYKLSFARAVFIYKVTLEKRLRAS